ncbi:hypothetical protein THAOC_27840, partial [Thalassiosira oceanica]
MAGNTDLLKGMLGIGQQARARRDPSEAKDGNKGRDDAPDSRDPAEAQPSASSSRRSSSEAGEGPPGGTAGRPRAEEEEPRQGGTQGLQAGGTARPRPRKIRSKGRPRGRPVPTAKGRRF